MSHEYHNESVQDYNLAELFPQPDSKKEPAVMYNRAMKQLKTILHNKGLKDSILSNTNFGMIHFHIEASDNNISLNKFDSKKHIPHISLINEKGLAVPRAKYANELSTLRSVGS